MKLHMKTLWKLSKEAIRYRSLYILAIMATLSLTLVKLTAPKVLSEMTAVVKNGVDQNGLITIRRLTFILVILYNPCGKTRKS